MYGIDIPPVVKFRNGYEQGARFINPDINLLGVYIPSFTDPAAIREFAKSVDLLTVEIEHVDANALEVRAGYGSGCIASRGKGPS